MNRSSTKIDIDSHRVHAGPPIRVVRGYGPLDLYLARKRCKTAVRHLWQVPNRRRILDIGCGAYPLFLTQVDFAEKYGVDQGVSSDVQEHTRQQGITIRDMDPQKETTLPWEHDYFDVVTMLAVFEHIEPERLPSLLSEIYRILKPQGRFMLTTPAPWADKLLRLLAGLKIISAAEINDHKGAYSHKTLAAYMSDAGFAKDKMKFGYFELFLNIWAFADK